MRLTFGAKEDSMSVGKMKMAVVAACLGLSAIAGCGSKDEPKGQHEIWFMGSVVDGVTGSLVMDYTLTLVYGSHSVKGTVDATTGRYVVGPLPAWNDYGIIISSTGYRAFSSYNAGISPPAPPASSVSSDVYTSSTTQTKDFDAYVFPDSVAVPSTIVTIVESGANPMPASGNIRLQPTNTSTLQQSLVTEVPMQVWTNDNDTLASVVSGTFTNGTFAVPDQTLVFGVTYQIVIYGVAGYQTGSGTIQAGVQTGTLVSIAPTQGTPLVLVSQTPMPCVAYNTPVSTTTPVAQVVLTFNQKIEDATPTTGKGPEVLDNQVSVFTVAGYSLKPNVSATVQERGTSFVIADNTLTLSFNPSVGLTTVSPGDVLQYVNYYGFTSIYLQPAGHADQKVTLSSLLNGQPSITCGM
jgi:hypothetical protein